MLTTTFRWWSATGAGSEHCACVCARNSRTERTTIRIHRYRAARFSAALNCPATVRIWLSPYRFARAKCSCAAKRATPVESNTYVEVTAGSNVGVITQCGLGDTGVGLRSDLETQHAASLRCTGSKPFSVEH